MITNKLSADMIAKDLNSGYWAVAENYFFHKGDALRYASSINSTAVTYHFYDQIFDSTSWIEPVESYKTLCKRRAQEIRDKYKYVALAFSGGADSTNVLHSFLDNNIKLDEVWTHFNIRDAENMVNTRKIDNSPENFMVEYLAVIKPKLKWLAEHHPDIKITVLDTSEVSKEDIINCQVYDSAYAGLIISPNAAGWKIMRESMLRYGNDAVTVHGIDKPRLGYNHVTQKFYTYFHDFNTCHGNWAHKPGEYTATEYFYYAKSMPELLVKGVHLIKNAVAPIVNTEFFKTFSFASNAGPQFSIIDVHSNFIKSVLYPDWDNNTFQVEKCKNFFWLEYSQHTLADSKIADFWAGQLNEFLHGIDPKFLIRDPDGKLNKMRDYFTKLRYLN